MSRPGRSSNAASTFLELSRIKEWWVISVALTIFAFVPYVYVANGDTITLAQILEIFLSRRWTFAVVTIVSAQIFLFASNDYFDRHVDMLDPKKRKRNLICAGKVAERDLWVLLGASVVVAVAFAAVLGAGALLFTMFSLCIFYFYTAEPIRLKNKIGLDILSHAALINTFPYLFCLLLLEYYSIGTIYFASILMLRSAMAQTLQEVRDYEADKQVERNTVIAIGKKNAIWLVFAFYLAIFTSSVILLFTYQTIGFGIPMTYLIVPILCIAYIPKFRALMTAMEYGDPIETLWMGQGRTNRWLGTLYAGSFGAYFSILWYFSF